MNNAFNLYDHDKNLLNAAMASKQQISESQKTPPRLDVQDKVTFDDLLVAVGKTRNRDAFVRLFEYFAPRVKSFMMKGGISEELADEMAQEALLTIWRKAESFDPSKASASTWIFTIARNKKIDTLRKLKRPEPDANDPLLSPGDTTLPDELVNRGEENKALAAAIKDLPDEQRDLIFKSFYEEKSHSDIAEETELPLGTVKSRIRLGLERLRHTLEKKGL